MNELVWKGEHRIPAHTCTYMRIGEGSVIPSTTCSDRRFNIAYPIFCFFFISNILWNFLRKKKKYSDDHECFFVFLFRRLFCLTEVRRVYAKLEIAVNTKTAWKRVTLIASPRCIAAAAARSVWQLQLFTHCTGYSGFHVRKTSDTAWSCWSHATGR